MYNMYVYVNYIMSIIAIEFDVKCVSLVTLSTYSIVYIVIRTTMQNDSHQPTVLIYINL